MRTSLSIVTGAALVLGMSAPAEAYVVNWHDASDLPSDGQVLAVDQSDGDVLAMTSPYQDRQFVRRLDGRTGAVEWTTELTADHTSIAVDPTDGRVVLAGASDGLLELTVLDRGGQVLRDGDAGVAMRSVADLEVDPASGLACTLGPRGSKRSADGWVTSCWDRSGASAFSRTWSPSDDELTVAHQVVIDAERHRVFVAGMARRVDRARSTRQDLVLLSYDVGGGLRWERQRSGAVSGSDLEVALDPARGRIHLLAQPRTIRQPTKLFSFDTRGRSRFVRSWRDFNGGFASEVAVTPKGDIVAVESDGRRASIRTYRRSGRPRAAEIVRVADRGDAGGGLPQVAIDPARGRVHVVNERDRSRGAVLWSFNASGRRTSSVLVDDGTDVLVRSIGLHDDSGTVITSTFSWQSGRDLVVSVRP